ncbi:aminoglycoside phosphotransferase family protein [Allokutzneria sp. A3M-2-11 16]|uniref:phosphotransferase n=1 Tax=Allokutzneria sp. A3M-2-11 16 TaxID=2962043 RepID=UPI0020B64663|nr:phosphotransferase [Allokutzneria sp. A3M-2-11 16]MCP3800358.1 aminoglycoside phosphotransferase family protein [Allokutzneria sp. A3M-2-11 16]
MTNPLLAPEPATDADARFRNWMRLNLARAATEYDLTITGTPVFGWRLRSISAPAHSPDGPRWLRVVTEEPQWAQGDGWSGNTDAAALVGIPKPVVLASTEWAEGEWRRQRAEVMTLLPGHPCSSTDVLRDELDLPQEWWTELRTCLGTLAATPTTRVNADQEKVNRRIHSAFGPGVTLDIQQWETIHGDLHWANLMHPRLGVLDWELWGTGPAGTDAATLYCYSLLAPETARTVHEVFADILDSPTGHAAQLSVIARLLRRAEQGDHPDLINPLRHRAATLLRISGSSTSP